MSSYLVSCRLAPCSATPVLAVRNGLEVVERDGNWIESFAPGSIVIPSRGATVELGHDEEAIGSVVTIAGSGEWIHADFTVDDPSPDVLERLRPGVPVSLGAQSLACDDNLDTRVRRHLLCELEHVAIARRGELAGYRGAVVTGVRESKIAARWSKANGGDWRAMLPPDWADFRNDKIDLQPGDTLLKGGQLGGGIVWDGHKFARPSARIAA